MHVQNNTDRILVFGKSVIEPKGVGSLPIEFNDRPTVKMLLQTGQINAIKSIEPGPSIVELLADKEPEPVTFESDGNGIPPDWDELHGNKCRAWIRKQEDVALLGKMVAVESRPKIRDALQARFDTLEARP